MGAIEPNEEEAKEIQARLQAQSQQPDPNQQYLAALSAESMAKAEKAKADTQLTAMKAQQSQVDTIHTAAKAEETRAKTAQIMSEMDVKSQRAVVENIKDLTQIEQQKAPTAPSR